VSPSRIRPATLDDLDELLAIEEAAFPGDRMSRRSFRHAVGSPTLALLVAPSRAGLLGYVLVEMRRTARLAHVSSIAVSKRARGQGLGRRLLRAAERLARADGRERIRLEVRADNAPAQALYEHDGYVRTGVEEDYYEDGTAAWRYEKRLKLRG
jgi:ribosomal-protein-alanine acetyltransferase